MVFIISNSNEKLGEVNIKIIFTSNFSYMFSNLINLKSIDLTNFNGSSINNTMEGMFYNCSQLQELYLPNLDFSYTTNIKNIFKECYSLTSINLSNFTTSYIDDFSNIFYDCNLTILDLSNFKGSKVMNRMDYMFNNCKNIISLDLSNLDLTYTTNISYMFNECISLKNITIINLNESIIEDYSYMFNECNSLEYIDLSNFKGSKVTNRMDYMFNNCNNLISINLLSFDTSLTTDFSHSVTYTNAYCGALSFIFNGTAMNMRYWCLFRFTSFMFNIFPIYSFYYPIYLLYPSMIEVRFFFSCYFSCYLYHSHSLDMFLSMPFLYRLSLRKSYGTLVF